MTRSLLAASWLAVRRGPLLLPAGAAVLLVAATAPWQDSGHAVPVLNGVAVLAACAWVATLDDPAGEVVAASPYSRMRRTLLRMAAGLVVVLPVLALGASVAELRFAPTPLLPAAFEAVGYALAGAALGAALRAWRGILAPAYPALIALLALVLITYWLPDSWNMVDPQPWGPPLVAALIRWTALALLALGVLALALRDPAEGRSPS
jgi:hypothetical protein